MDQKLRSFIDSLRVNRHMVTTAGQLADLLEQHFAEPFQSAFTAEQLQVLVNISTAVSNTALTQAKQHTDEKLAELRKELLPHVAQ